MAKFTLCSQLAAETCMVILAREVLVHVQAFLLLGTAVHHVEFAQLHLTLWLNIMRVRTCFALEGEEKEK